MGADQNRRGMNKLNVSKQNQPLRSVLVHVVSALICALVCSYSYWFPWLYCLINHFLWIYLPSVSPVVFGPKCMFVVANAIVAVVVGEWRHTRAESERLHQDMYEDYVRRSRRPSRVPVYKKVERKEDNNVKETFVKAIEIKKEEMIKETVVNSSAEEKKEEMTEEVNMSTYVEEEIINTDANNSEEKDEEMIEEASSRNNTDDEKKEEMNEEDDANNFDEKESATVQDHEGASEAGPHDEDKGEDGEAEETTRADDELNKRVEDFIARVNKRRWIEANNWLICSSA